MRAAVVARRAHRGARGRDQPGPGQPGPGQPVAACPGPASWSAWCARSIFSPEDLALVKGDPSDRRRVPRRPAGAAHAAAGRRPRRLRPGAQAAQLPAQDRRRRAARVVVAGGARSSTLGGLGRAPRPAPAPSCSAERLALVDELRPYVGKAYETVARGASRDDAEIEYKPSSRARRAAPTAPTSPSALLAELERRRNDELDRGISLVGPHRDELLL